MGFYIPARLCTYTVAVLPSKDEKILSTGSDIAAIEFEPTAMISPCRAGSLFSLSSISLALYLLTRNIAAYSGLTTGSPIDFNKPWTNRTDFVHTR